jgi:hypothetical protein
MITPSDGTSAPAYTRDSVEAYLRAADSERVRIERAIAEARSRTHRALHTMQRLDLLEQGTLPDGGPGAAADANVIGATRPLEDSDSTVTDSSRLVGQLHSALADSGSGRWHDDTAAAVAGD